MKNLKKFAALLLAGAMALLMLTACGGGGGDFGKRDPDAEDKAFNRFTSTAQASGLKENDKSLQAVNCTPFVRQYGILFRKWGVFVCQRDNESTTERRR